MRRKRLFPGWILWGWLLSTQMVWAGDLTRIQVRGNKRVEAEAVKSVLRSKLGAVLDPSTLADDIRAIYGLGTFEDVRAEKEDSPEGTTLIFVVVEKPSIASISYQGNDEIDTDKLKEVVDIQPLSVMDVNKIRKNTDKIRDLYIEKGFFLAEVSYQLKKQPENQVDLMFVVDERAKVQVRRIHFSGNAQIKDEELTANMATQEAGFFSFLTSSGVYKEENLKRDVYAISDYYYNHGFINVKVSEPIVEISRDRSALFITFPIEEGERFRFGKMGFSGELLASEAQILQAIDQALVADGGASLVLPSDLEVALGERLAPAKREALVRLRAEVARRVQRRLWEEDDPIQASGDTLRDRLRSALLDALKGRVLTGLLLVKKGELFNRTQLHMSLMRLQEVFKDRGYAFAEVVPDVNIDAQNRIVDINFSVQRGRKVFIERIEMVGNVRTRDKVIRRQMRVYEGELYSGSGLEASRRRVQALGFFEKVEISDKRGSGPDRIVLKVDVKERPTGTFQIGAGFSSVENFIATAQIAQQNSFGRGQSLSLMAQISSLRQYFSLQFVEPYFLDTPWYLSFSLYNMQLDYINFLREASGGTLTLGYEFIDDWRVSVTYTLETVDVSASRAGSTARRDLFRDGITSSLQLSLSWDTRDNRLFPSDGHLLQASVEHASEFTLSQNDFTRYSGVVRYYFPIIWGFVLKTNLTLGYVTSYSGDPVPIFEKYYLGGIYNIRGYEPRSIGPSEKDNRSSVDYLAGLTQFNIGGTKQLWGNVEVEFPIIPQANIRGVVFLDAGNAYGESEAFLHNRDSFSYAGLYWSWGFGFRWISPIGPLRFEWGIPLTPRLTDRDILFEFTIGNFF